MTIKSQDTEKLFDTIAQFVAECRMVLASGELTQLGGLDQQIQLLCNAVLQLSEEEKITYAGKLQSLLDDLKRLGEEMAENRDRIADEIRGVPHHKKASVAYRVVDASDGYGDKDEEDEE